MAQAITEKDKVHEDWYNVKPNNPEELKAFATKLMTEYTHDYGTIVHAATALALAAAWMVDRDPTQGGLTGFQGSIIANLFVAKWLHIDGPFRRIEYSQLLYPQYEDEFQEISKDTAKWLREEAKKKLKDHPDAAPRVIEHWKKVADGYIPGGFVVRD